MQQLSRLYLTGLTRSHHVSWRLGPRMSFSSLMNSNSYGLSEEQLMLQDMAKSFADKELRPFAREWDEQKIFPRETLRKAGEAGLGGVFVSEESGGIGLSRVDGSVVFEALARGCTSTTAYLTIHNMCCWMLDKFGNDQQKEKHLPKLLSLEECSSYCLTEADSGSDAAGLSTKAVKDGNEFIINGSKAFISGAGSSELYLIMCRTGSDKTAKSISCILVEKDRKGVSFGKNESKMGWNSQPTRTVTLEDVRVPVSNLLGVEGEGFKMAMSGLDGGRLSIATCSIGAAFESYLQTVEYVKSRKQFNTPLSEFQNTQFVLAEMATKIHASRSVVRQAAGMLDNKTPGSTAFVAMAKRFATDNCFEAINQALQLHGGYGYLRDYPIERYLRDARVHQILEGTNEIMRLIVARDCLQDK